MRPLLPDNPHGLPAVRLAGLDPEKNHLKNGHLRRRVFPFILALVVLALSLPLPGWAAMGTWTTDGYLLSQRQNHTATLLDDGRVLVTGGSWNGVLFFSSAEIYQPATGAFSHTSGLSETRQYHTATQIGRAHV